MMNNPKHLFAMAALAVATALPAAAQEGEPLLILNEGFNDINTLTDWSFVNDSTPPGQSWFQGNSSIFRSQAGPTNAYIAANYLSAEGGSGNISNWLITPLLNLMGESNLSFFARSAVNPVGNDTMEVLFSSGAGLGDFTVIGIVGGLNPFRLPLHGRCGGVELYRHRYGQCNNRPRTFHLADAACGPGRTGSFTPQSLDQPCRRRRS